MANIVYEIKTEDKNCRQFHIECDNEKLLNNTITLLQGLPRVENVTYEESTLSLWKSSLYAWNDLKSWDGFHTYFSIKASIDILKLGKVPEEEPVEHIDSATDRKAYEPLYKMSPSLQKNVEKAIDLHNSIVVDKNPIDPEIFAPLTDTDNRNGTDRSKS